MPDRDPEPGPNSRLLTGLIWAGLGLAPVAALIVMIGQSVGATRVAVLLLAVSAVLIGASLLVRNDPVVRSMAVHDQLEAFRASLRAELAARPTPAGPEFAGPQFADPQFADPQFAGREFADPQFAGREFAGSEFTGSEFGGSELAGREFARSELAGPAGAARPKLNGRAASSRPEVARDSVHRTPAESDFFRDQPMYPPPGDDEFADPFPGPRADPVQGQPAGRRTPGPGRASVPAPAAHFSHRDADRSPDDHEPDLSAGRPDPGRVSGRAQPGVRTGSRVPGEALGGRVPGEALGSRVPGEAPGGRAPAEPTGGRGTGGLTSGRVPGGTAGGRVTSGRVPAARGPGAFDGGPEPGASTGGREAGSVSGVRRPGSSSRAVTGGRDREATTGGRDREATTGGRDREATTGGRVGGAVVASASVSPVPVQRGTAAVASVSPPVPARAAAARYGHPENLDDDFGASDGYASGSDDFPAADEESRPINRSAAVGHAYGSAKVGGPAAGDDFSPVEVGYGSPEANPYGRSRYGRTSAAHVGAGYASPENVASGTVSGVYGRASAAGHGPADDGADGPDARGAYGPGIGAGYADGDRDAYGYGGGDGGGYDQSYGYGSAGGGYDGDGQGGGYDDGYGQGGGYDDGDGFGSGEYGGGFLDAAGYGMDGGYDGPRVRSTGDPDYRARRHRPSANDTNVGTHAEFASYGGWPDERYVHRAGRRTR